MSDKNADLGFSVIEAIDHISALTEIDEMPTGEKRGEDFEWRKEKIKESFRSLLAYLKAAYEKDSGQFRGEQAQKALQAVIALAMEAVQKMDRYTELFPEGAAAEIKEYNELLHFYHLKASERFRTPKDSQIWHEDWGSGEVGYHSLMITHLISVREDKDYELFSMKQEDGTPFFTRSLLQHLQYVGEFEELLNELQGKKFFSQFPLFKDRELHQNAKEILHALSVEVSEYLKESARHKELEIIAEVNKALMALMLAANPGNLSQNIQGKSAFDYYSDFHFYLRRALHTKEYLEGANHSSRSADLKGSAIRLIHELCFFSFLKGGALLEISAWLDRFTEMQEGEGADSPCSFWNQLKTEDERLRTWIQSLPNGPLLKVLSQFKEGIEIEGFDSFLQRNYPHQLYAIIGDQFHISCLHLPSPTFQKGLDQAVVVQEFIGFLRALGLQKRRQKHLLINIQDRTSRKEYGRSVAIEHLANSEEFSETLFVVTLPKNGDFYWQAEEYADLNSAAKFMSQFQKRIEEGNQCGYYFPGSQSSKELLIFSVKAMTVVHNLFFGGKETLLPQNRLDFIEIFDLIFSLKLIDLFHPDSLSFTCKDGVDVGAILSGELFAFLHMMNTQAPWDSKEKRFFRWLCYAQAFSTRGRVVASGPAHRAFSALSVVASELEAHRSQVITACSQLYSLPFFKGPTGISHAA